MNAITEGHARALGVLADQSDHRSDPKPDLPSNATDAEPLGPQGQRCLHFPGVALLHRTSPKLLPFSTSTSKPGHCALSDHRTLELGEHTEHLDSHA